MAASSRVGAGLIARTRHRGITRRLLVGLRREGQDYTLPHEGAFLHAAHHQCRVMVIDNVMVDMRDAPVTGSEPCGHCPRAFRSADLRSRAVPDGRGLAAARQEAAGAGVAAGGAGTARGATDAHQWSTTGWTAVCSGGVAAPIALV